MKPAASVLVVMAAMSLCVATAHAQPVGQAEKEGWSPEGYLLSLGVGAYHPSGNEAFDQFYSGENGPLLLVTFDFFLYRIPFVGPIGIDIAGGWAGYKGTAPPSTQTLKFSIFPLNTMVVLRIDALARETPVPFVFSGKIGYTNLFYNENTGAGKQGGRSGGLGWAARFALELNFINPRRANALDEDWGINSSFFFFELAGVNDKSGAALGDKLYFTGGLGLTF
ncbi:MAG: hypothetical protein PVH21_17885 [Myxococcales bacterium]